MPLRVALSMATRLRCTTIAVRSAPKLRLNNAVQPESAFMAESTYRQYLEGTLMQSVSNDTINPRGYDMMFGPMIPFNDTLIEEKRQVNSP